MGKKLYVGNLPYSATDAELQSIFAQSGTVTSAKVIFDRETNRSKGFGFVEMSTEEEATQAIASFNGADFGGRSLTVNEAKPMAPRAPRTTPSYASAPADYGNSTDYGHGGGGRDNRDRRDRRDRY
jgi:RNA recognition motif-containing protein